MILTVVQSKIIKWLAALSALVIFSLVLVIHIKCYRSKEVLIVQLPEGKIVGHILKSGSYNNFYAFQQIPYASPPIGTNRFKEPKESISWEHVLDATKNTKVCMQVTTSYPNLNLTEDCLYLNVYTPVRPVRNNKPLPVLFFIHGGEFKFGSGILNEYNPKFLMDYGIVVVTINYRLGALGFLSTYDGTIPANLGIKDQLKALKWVYQNIYLFGGDKERITVMGSSAGAMVAGYINLSEQAEGLIKGLILTSGSPISPCSYQDKTDYFAFKLGKMLDRKFNSNNTHDLLELLHKSSAQKIVSAEVIDDIYNNPVSPNLIWIPTIERENNKNALMTKPMLEAISKGDFNRVPIIFGINSLEGISYVKDLEKTKKDAKKMDDDPGLLINPRLHILPEELTSAGEEYRNIYTSLKFQDNLAAFVQYMGDEMFATPTIHHAALASPYTPAYFFQLSYKGRMGDQHTLNISGADGVGHGTELNYIFKPHKEDNIQFPEEDKLTQKRFLTLLTNFVKYQNPTPFADSLLQGIIWPQIKENNLRYLDIDNNLTIRKNPRNYLKVKSVLEKYRRKPYIVF